MRDDERLMSVTREGRRTSSPITGPALLLLLSSVVRCTPEARAPDRPNQTDGSPAEAAAIPPPLKGSYPTNSTNRQRFERFRAVEKVDDDWAPQTEKGLRARLRDYDADERRLMLIECRTETCVVGLVAWLPGGPNQAPPWPDIEWAGAAAGRLELRPDRWSELVYVLKRHPSDYPNAVGGSRVQSLASPSANPSCAGFLPGVLKKAKECGGLIRSPVRQLCFDTTDSACACACSMIGVDPPSCLREAGGQGVRCTTKMRNKLNDVFAGD
jgi:hypothetical protein